MKGDYNFSNHREPLAQVRDDPHMKGDYNNHAVTEMPRLVRDDPHMKGDYNARDRARAEKKSSR